MENSISLKFADSEWHPFDNGKTIGRKGSEGGKMIMDIENIKGARLSLEKDCGNIPFAITIGIYGLMVHTEFESDLDEATEYIIVAKFIINEIIAMHDIEENKWDKDWYEKRQKLMEKLAYIPGT